MPDVAEGLSTGDDQIDPNSDAGFAASIASTLGKELDPQDAQRLEEGERSVESGLEVEEPSAQPRGPDGRYAAVETPAEEVVEETPPADDEVPVAEETQPSVDWQKRYEELNGVLGRQGQELGELRRALQEREQQREQQQSLPDLPILDEATTARLDQMVGEYGGPEAMTWIAQNRPDLIDHAYDAWRRTEDPAADAAYTRYQAILAAGQMQQPQAQQPQETHPILREMELQRRLVSSLEQVKANAPDWEQIGPHFGDAFDNAPENVKQLVISENPALHEAGVFAIVENARVRHREQLASAAAVSGGERQAQQVAAKQAAGLTRGGMRPVAQRPQAGEAPADESPEQKSERVRVALHEALLNTETTDVLSGLTYDR